VGIEEIIENVLIVKIKDVGKRSPHHYCCMTGYRHFHLKRKLRLNKVLYMKMLRKRC